MLPLLPQLWDRYQLRPWHFGGPAEMSFRETETFLEHMEAQR